MNTAGITSQWMSYLKQVDAGLANQVFFARTPAHPQCSGGRTIVCALNNQVAGPHANAVSL